MPSPVYIGRTRPDTSTHPFSPLYASLLEHLREATRPHHDRLEGHPRLARLLAPDLSVAEYRRLLERLYGFYAPLEARVARYAGELPVSLADRRKAPCLAADLAALGVRREAVPQCPHLPRVDSAGAALGCLYVLEGATLGGRIIVRHLGRSLEPAHVAMAFYSGYGDATGPMWRAFCAALERAAPHLDPAAVVHAARQTFDCLEAWIDRRPT